VLRTTATDPDLRLPAAALPFLVVGAVAVVAGGVVAAVTRPTGFEQGSWVAAYLVLVGGVGLMALGTGQALLAPSAPERSVAGGQLAGWLVSAALVVMGTLASTPVVTAAGGLSLMAVLGSFVASVRGSSARGALIWCYRAVLVVLLVSIPVGLVLAWQRHG